MTGQSKSIRRKIDFDRIGNKILVLLYQQYMESTDFFVPFRDIVAAIPTEPKNAIWDELHNQIGKNAVIQKTETRHTTGFLALAAVGKNGQPETYETKVDGYKITRSAIALINQLSDEEFEVLSAEILAPNIPANKVEPDVWEPLPLDRQSTEFAKSVDAADLALKEIEGSNGYADSAPDERNTIVQTIKTNLDALKKGLISKGQILEGLIKPFQFVATKFMDASIGELAKRAAKFLWMLIGGS
jgi:hypothetical protein